MNKCIEIKEEYFKKQSYFIKKCCSFLFTENLQNSLLINIISIFSILCYSYKSIKNVLVATEKMDAMLPPNSTDAFEPLTTDVEDLKITTCADVFITLLQTITERYESLPQPGHRLQFLELQFELLDDFRVRLLQLVNAEEGDIIESIVPSIANSIYYIENVLMDWSSMLVGILICI